MSGKRSPRCHRRQKITEAPEHLREASIALGPCSSHELSVASLSPFWLHGGRVVTTELGGRTGQADGAMPRAGLGRLRFSLERHVLDTHLLRHIDRFVELDGLRRELLPFYSEMAGPPSIRSC